ncbi:MAG: serine/threonine-protein kinase [Planctomycetota bacterium]
MQPERDAGPAKPPPGDGTRSTSVQQAVELFVELHATGQAPDPATFASRFPDDLKKAVLLQCREFLAFDGLLGHQEWEPGPAKETQGRPFGDFVIQEELGRGGMGIVYLAHQKSLNRRVALKVMASGLTLSKRHVERFRREAAAAAQLRHPAIVSVHSLTEVDGTFALAMDFVAGRNLADILDDLRLLNGDAPTVIDGTLGLAPEKGYVAECAMFVAQLASALAVAHQANVVHRDLKPRNLMLDDRRQVKLLDFGLAKSLGEGSISMSGEITGTAHYMSPEQTLAKRVEIDHRADIWSLGVILYELLTLRRPFDGKNLQQVVYEICFQEPVPMQKRNHRVPRDLVTICQKALEKDPSKRYQTAAEFEADLQRFLRWEPVHARPASATTRLLKWARRHRTETAIAGALVLGGMTLLGLRWHEGRQADELLAQAAVAEAEGRFDEAAALATRAVALRNDEVARARLKSYGEAQQRIIAEAANLAARSSQEKERDREKAIALALAAVQQHADIETRSAVLDALDSGCVTRTLRVGEGNRAPRLVGVRWSPDGTTAATFGYDGQVRLWDPATGTALASLKGHAEEATVVGVCFAGNDRLITAGADKTLRCWRRHDAALEQTIPVPGVPATMRGDREGKRVLVTSYISSATTKLPEPPFLAQVYDTATGQVVSPAVAHSQLFVESALSPCGTIAATCCSSTLRIWPTDTGVPITPGGIPRGRVRALEFAPDSSLLAVATDHTVQLLRVRDGELVGQARHSLEVTSLAFDSKGQRLLSGSRDRTARVWSLQPGGAPGHFDLIEVATLGNRGPVDHVAFDPTDQLALTATGQAGELVVFDVGAGRESTGAVLHRYEAGPSILGASFAPGGHAVLALAGQFRPLVWDFGSARGVLTVRQTGWAGAVAFDRTGERFVTGGTDYRVRLWSASDGNLKWTSANLRNPQGRLDVDEAGDRIATASTRDGVVHVLRLADGEALYDLDGKGSGTAAVRFLPGGNRLLAAGAGEKGGGGLLLLWNTNDRSRAFELLRPQPIVAADVRADGGMVATVENTQRVVRLWAVPNGEPRGELAGHGDVVSQVRFSPDGRTVLTASQDRKARIFDLTGKLLQTLSTEQQLRHAAFDRNGDHVLTCGDGSAGEAVLWRVADGTGVLRFRGHRGPIDHGAFHPEGSAIATTARDGTVCLWPTDPVAVARRLLPGATPASTTRK